MSKDKDQTAFQIRMLEGAAEAAKKYLERWETCQPRTLSTFMELVYLDGVKLGLDEGRRGTQEVIADLESQLKRGR